MKQSSVSPQTQTDEGQSTEGREKERGGGGSITKMTLAKMKEWPACKMHTNHSSIDIGYKAWADYFLTTFSIPSNSLC